MKQDEKKLGVTAIWNVELVEDLQVKSWGSLLKTDHARAMVAPVALYCPYCKHSKDCGSRC